MKSKDVSKLLSLVLRHQPQELELTLDANGWAEVDVLLVNLKKLKGAHITREELDHIVDTNDKKRFIYSDDRAKIRANQGHSINVDVQHKFAIPPTRLFHGTGVQNKASILEKGILNMQRLDVHLSQEESTAKQVGSRHGVPFIFVVDTEQMHKDGKKFRLAENGVWLVDYVDPKYLILIN